MSDEYSSVEGSGTTPIIANGKRGEDGTVDSSTMYTGPTRSDVVDDDDELDNSTFYSGEDVTLEDRDSFRKEDLLFWKNMIFFFWDDKIFLFWRKEIFF